MVDDLQAKHRQCAQDWRAYQALIGRPMGVNVGKNQSAPATKYVHVDRPCPLPNHFGHTIHECLALKAIANEQRK